MVNTSQRSQLPGYRERESHVHFAIHLNGALFWTSISDVKFMSFRCTVGTKREAVSGKESCLNFVNMPSHVCSGIEFSGYKFHCVIGFLFNRELKNVKQVCWLGATL